MTNRKQLLIMPLTIEPRALAELLVTLEALADASEERGDEMWARHLRSLAQDLAAEAEVSS